MKKKKKKKKNKKLQNIQKAKFLLETSAQITRITPSVKKDQISNLASKGLFYSSYFVLYEFKTGLIKTILEYYFLAKSVENPFEAITIWSNKFATREIKNHTLLQAKIGQLFGTIEARNREKHLRQIRAVVFDLISNFDTEIVSLVGEFGSDEIVKARLFTETDYSKFLETYNARKCIPMQKFWQKHSSELKNLTSNAKVMQKTDSLKKIHAYLVEIERDINKADSYNINKGSGDAVIAVDAPSSMIITTLDHSFETLCPILTKKHLII